MKLVDVRPEYPPSLSDVQGESRVVHLEANIRTDGYVGDVRVVSSADPDVENAAIAAVRQWQFTPTYLNCVPIEVKMNVSLTFKPRQ